MDGSEERNSKEAKSGGRRSERKRDGRGDTDGARPCRAAARFAAERSVPCTPHVRLTQGTARKCVVASRAPSRAPRIARFGSDARPTSGGEHFSKIFGLTGAPPRTEFSSDLVLRLLPTRHAAARLLEEGHDQRAGFA